MPRSQSKALTPPPLADALDRVIDNIGKKGAKDKTKSASKASKKAPGE